MKQLLRCLKHVLSLGVHKGRFIASVGGIERLARKPKPYFFQCGEMESGAFNEDLLCLRQGYKHRSATLQRMPYVSGKQYRMTAEKSGAKTLQSICGDLGESGLQCFVEVGVHVAHCIRTWCGSVKPAGAALGTALLLTLPLTAQPTASIPRQSEFGHKAWQAPGSSLPVSGAILGEVRGVTSTPPELFMWMGAGTGWVSLGGSGGSGSVGPQGPAGAAATIAVGTVSTGAPGSSATVTNTGTSSAAVFDFAIPRGDVGATGATGATGPTGLAGPQGDAGADGAAGTPGAAATVAAGTTTTGLPGTLASVVNAGTSSAAIFDFTIPRGDVGPAGADGAPGATGPAGADGPTGAQGPAGDDGIPRTIQDEAVDLTQRLKINFTGASITCEDNAGTGSTDCTVTDDDTPESGDFGALALTGPVTSSGLATTIAADAVTLGTQTSGGYAASTTEGGAATTATALAANGTNCDPGEFSGGVDASGNAEDCAAAGGGLGGFTGPTDNAALRAHGGAGGTAQGSDLTISDVSASTVTVAASTGNALALTSSAPLPTGGASQAGVAASLTASPAVASTDTAGAAAGGVVNITAGSAARLTSGNANGGDINLTTGAGIGTGTAGVVATNGVMRSAGSTTIPGFGGTVAAGATGMGVTAGGAGVSVISGGAERARYSNAVFSLLSSMSLGWATGISNSDLLLGRAAVASMYTRGGNFAANGDAQGTTRILRGSTATATPAELFLDGSSTRLTVPSDSTWTFSCLVSARRTDADNESAGYRIEGVIDNNAGTTALVGSTVQTVMGEDTATWDVTAAASDASDALTITATGEASKTIRWVAVCQTSEVMG